MSRLPAAICGSLLSSFRYSLRWPVSTLVCKKFKRQYSQQIQNPSKFLITKLNLFNLVIRTLHSYNKIFNFKKSFRIFISCRFWICWEQCHLISIYLLLHLLLLHWRLAFGGVIFWFLMEKNKTKNKHSDLA